MTSSPDVRLTVWIHGQVQGVGFRWWTRARAAELGLRGRVSNLPDGRVEVIAVGPRCRCEALLELLTGAGTPGRVHRVAESWGSAPSETWRGFEIS